MLKPSPPQRVSRICGESGPGFRKNLEKTSSRPERSGVQVRALGKQAGPSVGTDGRGLE